MESIKYDRFNRAIEYYYNKVVYLNEFFDSIFRHSKPNLDFINEQYKRYVECHPEGDINAIQEIRENLPALSADGLLKYQGYISERMEEVNSHMHDFIAIINSQFNISPGGPYPINDMKEVVEKEKIKVTNKENGEKYFLKIDTADLLSQITKAEEIKHANQFDINTARDEDENAFGSILENPIQIKNIEEAEKIFAIEAGNFMPLWTDFHSRILTITKSLLPEDPEEPALEEAENLKARTKLLLLRELGILKMLIEGYSNRFDGKLNDNQLSKLIGSLLGEKTTTIYKDLFAVYYNTKNSKNEFPIGARSVNAIKQFLLQFGMDEIQNLPLKGNRES